MATSAIFLEHRHCLVRHSCRHGNPELSGGHEMRKQTARSLNLTVVRSSGKTSGRISRLFQTVSVCHWTLFTSRILTNSNETTECATVLRLTSQNLLKLFLKLLPVCLSWRYCLSWKDCLSSEYFLYRRRFRWWLGPRPSSSIRYGTLSFSTWCIITYFWGNTSRRFGTRGFQKSFYRFPAFVPPSSPCLVAILCFFSLSPPIPSPRLPMSHGIMATHTAGCFCRRERDTRSCWRDRAGRKEKQPTHDIVCVFWGSKFFFFFLREMVQSGYPIFFLKWFATWEAMIGFCFARSQKTGWKVKS